MDKRILGSIIVILILLGVLWVFASSDFIDVHISGWTNGTEANFTNVVADNVTVNEYFYGQPLDGSLDSGIIWAVAFDENANLNLSHTSGTLNIAYPNFIVRLVNSSGNVQYCNIPGATVAVTDEQHSVYYVDANCDVQSTAITNYIITDLSPGGITEFFNAMAHSGDVEVHLGAPLQSKINIKTRKASFNVAHLRTTSGLNIITEIFSNFTISIGEYVFINDIMTTTVQNHTNGSTLEIVYRDGGAWKLDEVSDKTQTGLNLTSCDDGTDVVTCTNTNRFRRYFIFVTGFEELDDETEIHQRLADEDTTYMNVGSCLDVIANPVSYSIPDFYDYTAVPLYMYCGRAVDTTWTTNFIDLRTFQVGAAASEVDTSIFLTKDGSRPLTANWDAGDYNITTTKTFNGRFNWSVLSSFLSFTGYILDFSSAKLNDTINALATGLSSAKVNETIRALPTGNTTAEIQKASDVYVNITGDTMTGNLTTTQWFNGLFNWTTLSGFLSFSGSILDFSSSKLNWTIGNEIRTKPTGNSTAEIQAAQKYNSSAELADQIRVYSTGNTTAELDVYLNTNRTGGDVFFKYNITVNWTCFNPACTSRIGDNGTDLIFERL